MSKGQRWVVDSGILRKKNNDEQPQELLVFGYSCKLFRDDDKAKLIDQGKHLIPWMGDNTLKIDRYDGRGALADLGMYEPPSGGFDQRTILTDEELKVEQLCDVERYHSLYNNDAEESICHEEEMKKLHQALDSEVSFNQVGYNYNEDENGHKILAEDSQSPKQSEDSQEDQAFVPPPELEIPKEIILPETQKLHTIITKAALFVKEHGAQLEILIKTKQANNPQFAFLSIDNPLYQYYKYILDAIKSGKYNPKKEEKEAENTNNESEPEEESDQDDVPYLHPSLTSSFTKIEAAPSIPSIQYKPSANCAYSMLVNKITGKPPPSKIPQVLESVIPSVPSTEYYQPMLQNYTYPAPMQYSHGPVIYGSNGQVQSTSQLAVPTVPNNVVTTQIPSFKETSMPLVPYGASMQKPLSRPSFIVPPADIQIIIDKMASYVAKNGRDFETIVKNKGDPRFNFLELSHQYHGYYAHKLTMYEGAINPKVLTEEELLQKQEPQEEKQKKLEELQKKQQRMEEVQKRVKMIQAKKKNGGEMKKDYASSTKQITTVSFSIKKPKDGESTVIEKRNALPLEESDEEVTENEKKDANSKPSSPQGGITDAMNLSFNVADKDPSRKLKNDDKELVDLTEDILEDSQKEIRHKHVQEQDRIKDKLMVAHDKLLSKERQLQLERKKKAVIFLSNIQSPAIKVGSTATNQNINRKDDSDDVHSVPSPSLDDNKDRSLQDAKSIGNSLMDRLKSADLSGKRSRPRSRSRSGSRTDRHRSHKKHKKRKTSHRSNYDNSSSSRSRKTKKSSSRHRSRSRSPSHRHRHYSRRRHDGSTSYSDSSSRS